MKPPRIHAGAGNAAGTAPTRSTEAELADGLKADAEKKPEAEDEAEAGAEGKPQEFPH